MKYFKEIADVLAYVNRQMILIFKTNDLLRGIESSLGTKNSMSTFIQVYKIKENTTMVQFYGRLTIIEQLQMSRACFKVIQEKESLESTSTFARYNY